MKDANSMKVTIDVLGKIDSFTKNLNLIQGQLNRLHLSDSLKDSFSNLFTDLEREISTVQKTVGNNQLNLIDEKKVTKSITRIDNLYGTLIKKLNSSGVDTAFLQEDRTALNGILKAQQSYTKEIKATLREQEKLNKKLEEAKEAKAKGGQEKNKTKVSSEKYSLMQSREKAAKSTKRNADKKVAEAQAKVDERIKNSGGKYTDVDSKGFKNTAEYQNLKKAIEEATQATNELKNAQEDLAKHTTTEKIEQEAKDLAEALDKAEKELQNFNNTKGKEGNSKALENVKKQLQEIKGINWSELGVDLNDIKSVEDLEQAYNKLSTAAGERAKQALGVIETASEQAGQEFSELKGKIDTATNSLDQMSSRQKDIENLRSRILQFFSIGNAVNLFRRAVISALNTVKELDATMTEAAVVTDFSVGDMWSQLPKYNEEATKLGAKINDLYAATTLYYQQGLKTNAAMGAGVETMKMARIAGIDASKATEAMTAALRGFNMEVNETNAQNVNDVYSSLAAQSASNTQQIATAMEKTASIAASANMEFETTAALLAQIIETTQEAPETAGTAMKTIIARFSEVKSLANKGLISGEDEEGEIIDVNKIQTALRTVGISMNEYFKGTEGLDDIFLKLAEKWKTLDFETQRYIATMAAGSRQQSRFIAMMSDYERTTELVSIANNSAGASSKQFEKTMESLEAKINMLTNAWQEFLMGIANEETIKIVIDLLTTLLKTLNTITNFGGKGNNAFSLVAKLGLTLGAMKIAKALLNKSLESLIPSFSAAGTKGGQKFVWSYTKQIEKASISQAALTKELSNYAAMTPGTQAQSQQLQVLQNQYHLTGAEVETYSKQVENSASMERIATEANNRQIQGLKQARAARIKNISTLAAFAAAIIIVIEGTKLLKKQLNDSIKTSQEKIDELQESLDSLEQESEELKNSLDNFSDNQNDFSQLIKQLSSLKKGTAEWTSTLYKAREQMNGILEKFPELKDYTEVINGVTTLTQEGWNQYEQKLQDAFLQNQSAIKAHEIQIQENSKFQQAEYTSVLTNTINEKEAKNISSGIEQGGTVGGIAAGAGGWIAGTAIGAKIGGTAGSVAGPIGLVIGALVGVLLGALIGGLVGGNAIASQGINPNNLNKIAEASLTYKKEDGTLLDVTKASEEEINDFVTEMSHSIDLGTLSIDDLTKYIKENREEFKELAESVSEANKQLMEMGYSMGLIEAERRGYTGKAAEAFAYIFQNELTDEFEHQKEIAYNTIATMTQNDLLSDENRQLISEFTGYWWDSVNNSWRDAQGHEVWENDKDENSFSTDEQKIALASAKALKEILKNTDKIFSNISSDQYDFLKTVGEITNNNIGKLSLETFNKYLQDFNEYFDQYTKLTYGSGLERQINPNYILSYWDTQADFKKTKENDGKSGVKPDKYLPDTTMATPIENLIDLGLITEKDFVITVDWEQSQTEHISTIQQDKFNLSKEDFLNFLKSTKKQQLVTELIEGKYYKGATTYDKIMISDVKLSFSADDYYNKLSNSDFFKGLPSYILEEVSKDTTNNILNNPELLDYYETLQERIKETKLEFLKKVSASDAYSFLGKYQKITDTSQINNLLKESGMDSFEDVLNSIFNDISSDKMNALSSLIGDIDFTNLTDLQNAQEMMEALDIEKEVVTKWEDLTNVLREGGYAYVNIDLETLIASLEKSYDIIKKINDLGFDEQLKLTKEEMDSIINLTKATDNITRDQFVATNDGFVYLGNNVEDLRKTLLQTNAYLIDLQNDALQKKVDQGEYIQEATSRNSGVQAIDWNNVNLWTDPELAQNLAAIFSSAHGAYRDENGNTLKMHGVTDEIFKENVSKIKASNPLLKDLPDELVYTMAKWRVEGSEYLDNAEVESGVRDIVKQWADSYIGLSGYREQLKSGLRDVEEQQLSNLSGQERLNTQKGRIKVGPRVGETVGSEITFYDGNKAIKGTIQADGSILDENNEIRNDIIWDSEKRKYVVDTETYDGGAVHRSMDAAIQSYAGGDITVERWTNELKNFGYSADELAKATYIDFKTTEGAIDDVNKVLDENIESLLNAKEGSTEYYQALDKVASGARKIFGDSVTAEFVEQNKQLFEQWSKGGEEGQKAFEEIGKKIAAIDIAKDMKISSKDATKIVEEISNSLPPVKVGIAFDMTSYIKDWMKLYKWTEEQAIQYAESLGYTVTVMNGLYAGVKQSAEGSGINTKTEDTKNWKNPFDKYFNKVEALNELLRKRNLLEKEYERILAKQNTTPGELEKYRTNLLKNLEEEIKRRKELAGYRLQEIKDAKKATYEVKNGVVKSYQQAFKSAGGGSLDQYGIYNEKTGQVEIDHAALDKLQKRNAELGTIAEAYINYLKDKEGEYEDELEGVQDGIDQINDTIREATEQRSEYINTVAEAMQKRDQTLIDNAQALSDMLSTTNQEILDSLQESIDLEKQIRDNTKKEEEIADMEARLAYLRRDTSGANAQEIRELEKQLKDTTEEYGDTLIDQEVERLSKENEKAEEQRTKQIELAQAQLDFWVKTGAYMTMAQNSNLSFEDFMQYWEDLNDYDSLNDYDKLIKNEEAARIFNSGSKDSSSLLSYDMQQNSYQDSSGRYFKKDLNSDKIRQVDKEGNFLENGAQYNISDIISGDFNTKTINFREDLGSALGILQQLDTVINSKSPADNIKKLQEGLNTLIRDGKLGQINTLLTIDGKYNQATRNAVKVLQNKLGSLNVDGIWGPKTHKALINNDEFKAYKTGGLADFTGPAWLDGTKSHPELVLNQRDTQNFIQLKDILAEILTGATSAHNISQSTKGDTYYDITIQVDSISSDYDVDQMAARIKQQIYEDSSYRNVNSISLMR